MATKVKTHKRKRKNGVSIVKEHSRKDNKKRGGCGSGKELSDKKSAKKGGCSSCGE